MNGTFNPMYSSNLIYRDDDDTRCVTLDLESIESDISSLETSKANASHIHTEYALLSHEHTNYASSNHTHSQYAIASDVSELQDLVGDTAVSTQINAAISSKADINHEHSIDAELNSTSTNPVQNKVIKAALDDKANSSHTHSNYALASLVSQTISIETSEEDTYITNIFAAMGDSTTKRVVVILSNGKWLWDFFRSSASYGYVIAYKYDVGGNVIIKSKDIYNGTLYPWSHLNPTMTIGVEYRTMEYWNSKPVYTKLVSLGNFPNNTRKAVQYISAPVDSAIRCVGTTSNGDSLPLRYDGQKIDVYASDQNIHLTTNFDASAMTGYAQVWYVK